MAVRTHALDVPNLLRVLRDGSIGWPVEEWAIVVVRVHLLKLLLREERLVPACTMTLRRCRRQNPDRGQSEQQCLLR